MGIEHRSAPDEGTTILMPMRLSVRSVSVQGVRVRRLLLVASILAAQLLVGALTPASACACGAFIDPADAGNDSHVLEETAVLAHRDGRETIIMGFQLGASRTGPALLVPTPTVPDVSAADADTLSEMRSATQPRQRIRYDYWGTSEEPPGLVGSGDDRGAAVPDSAAVVHSRQRIGSFDVAVLGGEAAPVRTWLADNGFALSDEVSPLLEPYAEEGWTFTAVRYADDAVLEDETEPLRFDFDSEQLVYPMRFSQAASVPQELNLYVISDQPMQRTDASEDEQISERPWIADPTDEDWTWTDDTLRGLIAPDDHDGRHGMVTQFRIWGEPESFTTDFAFAPDPEQDTVVPTYDVTEVVYLGPFPAGWTLTGIVVLLGNLITAIVTVIVLVLAQRGTRSPGTGAGAAR